MRSGCFSVLCRWLLLLAALAVSPLLWAQSETTGAIYGLLLTPDGKTGSAIQVHVRDSSTGAEAYTTSASNGRFLFPSLTPGSYELTVTTPGFAAERRNAIVELGRITSLRIELRLPSTEQRIEVTAQEPLLETTQSASSQTVGSDALEGLPSNGRRWSNFALLTPGTNPDGSYGLISFRGLSGVMNSSSVDGGDNNQAFFGEERGRTRLSYVMGQNSVREFQVNLSNFSAEYGRAAGGSVNAVTRSGGNHMHGEAFYYLRDSSFGASDPYSISAYFNAGNGEYQQWQLNPEDRRQQFGASIGGPIIKEKLFYFFNWDEQRRNFPGVAAASSSSLFEPPCVLVATTQQVLALNGKPYESQCSFNELSTLSNVMPTSSSTLDVYNAWLVGMVYLNGFTGEVPRQANHTILFPKLDWRINRNHRLSLSYNFLRWQSPGGTQTSPVTSLGTSSWGNSGVKADTILARFTSALAHSAANEARLQFSRDLEYDNYRGALATEPHTGPNGAAPYVSVDGSSGLSFGMPASLPRPNYPDERMVQFADAFAVVRGRHIFKFGGDISRVHDDVNNIYNGGGSYSYTYRDEFIADYLYWQNGNLAGWRSKHSHYSYYTQSFGQADWQFSTWNFAGFAQDEWRPSKGLTLSFGLRYEKQLLPSPQTPNPLLSQTESMPSDNNNFAPRFGFAWQPFHSASTVLRGGYGIYYGRLSNATIGAALSQTGTELAQRSYSWTSTTGPRFPYVMSDPYGTKAPDVVVLSPHLQLPQIHQADLILERQIAAHTILSVSGLLSVGHELQRYVDSNFVDPAISGGTASYTFANGPWAGDTLTIPLYTERINTAFGRITETRSDVNSTYSALMVQLRRRKAGGLMYNVHYTWSHALDNGQNSNLFSSTNGVWSPYPSWYSFNSVTRRINDSERGTSNYDIRQHLVLSMIYEPKFSTPQNGWIARAFNGWAIAPVIHANSGRPMSEYVAGSAASIPDNCQSCYGLNGSGGSARLPFLSRNSFRLPPTYYADLRLSRQFTVAFHRRWQRHLS